MPVDWSRKRRERAAVYLVMAEQETDERVRAVLLGIAQRWLDTSTEPPEAAAHDVWDKSYYQFLITSQVGRGLRAYFEVPRSLRRKFSTLLAKLDERENGNTRTRR